MKNIHKALGFIMLAPLILWALTGIIFLTKPGYNSAYEQLSPKLYPFEEPLQLGGSQQWSQIKAMKTVLGQHLLVLEQGSWKHLEASTLKAKQPPSPNEIRALVADALVGLSDRYGTITRVEGPTVFTDTDVVITLDWDTLSLQQKGPDTRLIDALYRIHYLQWFGSPALNQVLGVLGLVLLVALTLVGLFLLAGGRHDKSASEAEINK